MTVVISCLLSPDGGIGRRAGLKHLWETVPVRLRLRVQKPLRKKRFFWFLYFCYLKGGVALKGSSSKVGDYAKRLDNLNKKKSIFRTPLN